MKTISSFTAIASACAMAAALAAPAALADKPEWANGKGRASEHAKGSGWDRDHGERGRMHFDDGQRVVVRDYYVKELRSGHCPPGLAKKHNGCTPPGQAKKWQMGYPLPREVIFYDLPPSLLVQIGAPPSGYRFVRVASDILMIAVGTGLVVDAIQDLGRI